MKLSVLRALLVMPRSSGRALAGLPPLSRIFWFSSWKTNLSTCSSIRKSVSPTLLDFDPAEHLADDRLDVLVVDGDALETIDFLDLPEEVFGQLLLAQDPEDVVGVDRAVHEGHARPDALAVADADVGALGDEIFLLDPAVALDRELAEAADQAAELDDAVDFRNDRRQLGPPGFEQFLGSGQTARDILGLGLFARDLGQDGAGVELPRRPGPRGGLPTAGNTA